MTEYEYKLEPLLRNARRDVTTRDKVEDFLNTQGVDGWELVAIDYGSFIFKRIIAIEQGQVDWRPLSEDVSFHAMLGSIGHEDGRNCSYHARLDKWTFEGTKECLRLHPNPTDLMTRKKR